MTIEELLKKRANLSVRFDLPFLEQGQLIQHNAISAAELPSDATEEQKKDAIQYRDAERRQFVDKNTSIKLTVSRLGEGETHYVNRTALKRTIKLIQSNAPEASLEYSDAQASLLWPTLLKHVEKGQQFVNGEWQEVDFELVKQLLDGCTSEEQAFLMTEYLRLVEEDRKRAEGDPSFLEGTS